MTVIMRVVKREDKKNCLGNQASADDYCQGYQNVSQILS